MKAVTAEQIRRLEQRAVEAGASLDDLMENAGRAVAHEVVAHLGETLGARGPCTGWPRKQRRRRPCGCEAADGDGRRGQGVRSRR